MINLYKSKILVVFFIIIYGSCYSQSTQRIKNAYDQFDYTTCINLLDRKKLWNEADSKIALEAAYKIRDFAKVISYRDRVIKTRSLNQQEHFWVKDAKLQLKCDNENIKNHPLTPFRRNPDIDEFGLIEQDSTIYFISNKKTEWGVFHYDKMTDAPYLNIFKAHSNEKNDSRLKKLKGNFNVGPISKFGDKFLVTRNYSNKKGVVQLKMVIVDKDFNFIEEFKYNNANYSVGHGVVSKDNNVLVFASDQGNTPGLTDLFICYDSLGNWSLPKKLSNNVNSNRRELFPFIYDNVLYFSSDKMGGYGGLDLYKVKLFDTISEPQNLSPPLNSNNDDFGLYLIDDKKGYLSTNRLGTDDIFSFDFHKVEFECSFPCPNNPCVFLQVEGFQKSKSNRFHYFWDLGDGTKKKGFFLNHCYKKKGRYIVKLSAFDEVLNEYIENLVIDTIEVDDIAINNPSFESPMNVCVNHTVNFNSKINLSKGKIGKQYWEFDDKFTSEESNPSHVFSEVGLRKVKQHVQVLLGDSCCYQTFQTYVNVVEEINEDCSFKDTIVYANKENNKTDYEFWILGNDENQNTIKIEQNYLCNLHVLNQHGDSLKNVKLRLYSPKLNKYENYVLDNNKQLILNRETTYVLDIEHFSGKLLQQLITTKEKTEYEFKSYTFIIDSDNQGDVLTLENQFSLVVMDEQHNVIPLTTIKSQQDSILGLTKYDGTWNLPINFELERLKFSKLGYFERDYYVKNFKPNGIDTIILPKINENSIIKLENILFDLGRSTLKESSKLELNKVVKLMKSYPNMKIALHAHTDSRCEEGQNLVLSEKRALSSKNYIVSCGIEIDRISSKGFGEEKLLNHCANGVRCNEKLHEQNRRVEIVIINIE